MGFLKALWTVIKWSVITGVLSAICFSFGFIVRPEVFPHLPQDVRQLVGEEKSHKTVVPFEEWDNVMLVGVFDGFIADVDPKDYKALLSKDLKWLINVKLNAKVRSNLPVTGNMSYYVGAYDESDPRKESQTYMTEVGPISQLKMVLPNGDGTAYFITLTLQDVEEFSVKILKNEMADPIQVPEPNPSDPHPDEDIEDNDEF